MIYTIYIYSIIYIYIIFILYSDISEYNIQLTFDYLNLGPTWHPPPWDPRPLWWLWCPGRCDVGGRMLFGLDGLESAFKIYI